MQKYKKTPNRRNKSAVVKFKDLFLSHVQISRQRWTNKLVPNLHRIMGNVTQSREPEIKAARNKI